VVSTPCWCGVTVTYESGDGLTATGAVLPASVLSLLLALAGEPLGDRLDVIPVTRSVRVRGVRDREKGKRGELS
jgi:hypothetical protein